MLGLLKQECGGCGHPTSAESRQHPHIGAQGDSLAVSTKIHLSWPLQGSVEESRETTGAHLDTPLLEGRGFSKSTMHPAPGCSLWISASIFPRRASQDMLHHAIPVAGSGWWCLVAASSGEQWLAASAGLAVSLLNSACRWPQGSLEMRAM